MGFDPVSLLLTTGVAAIGGVQAADAAGAAKKRDEKIALDALALEKKQKTDREQMMKLGDAFNSLERSRRSANPGSGTIYSSKLGVAGA